MSGCPGGCVGLCRALDAEELSRPFQEFVRRKIIIVIPDGVRILSREKADRHRFRRTRGRELSGRLHGARGKGPGTACRLAIADNIGLHLMNDPFQPILSS